MLIPDKCWDLSGSYPAYCGPHLSVKQKKMLRCNQVNPLSWILMVQHITENGFSNDY